MRFAVHSFRRWGDSILCLFSTVCRFLSTRIMCLGNYHICTVHSYILQVFLFDLSCPDHAPVSGQQGDGETTSRECWGSQGSSSGWCGMSEIIMSAVRWRDMHVRGPGPMEHFPCGPMR